MNGAPAQRFGAPPDGYTLLLGSISNAISAVIYPRLNYDIVRHFAPITLLATTPGVLVVHPALPVKSVRELIALARARPDQIAYSSAGNGTPPHLSAELFSFMTGVKMIHVPYKGGGPSVIALLSGEVCVSFASMPSAIGHIRAGKLHALAVTTAQRAASARDLPTLSEAGAGLRCGNLARSGSACCHAERHHCAVARRGGKDIHAPGREGKARGSSLRRAPQHARGVRCVCPLGDRQVAQSRAGRAHSSGLTHASSC